MSEKKPEVFLCNPEEEDAQYEEVSITLSQEVIDDYMKAKRVIMGYFKTLFPNMPEAQLDHNAVNLIARLGSVGMVIDTVREPL